MSKPILMEALGYQNYNGQFYCLGEEIPVSCEIDAEDMVALNLARRKPVVTHRESTPKAAPQQGKKDKKDKKHQRYEHREMRVDES